MHYTGNYVVLLVCILQYSCLLVLAVTPTTTNDTTVSAGITDTSAQTSDTSNPTDTTTDINNSSPDTTPDTTSSDTTTADTTDTASTTVTTTDIPDTTSTTVTTDSSTLTTTPTTLPPVFVNISWMVSLDEKETRDIELDTFRCTDPEGGPTLVSISLPVSPATGRCANCFTVQPCGTELWCLEYLSGVGLLDMVRDRQYHVNITCVDQENKMTSSVVEVRLKRNAAPVFDPDISFVSLTVNDTQYKKSGEIVFDVNANDGDNDVIFYTMTVTPDNGNFQIDPVKGTIYATNDLSQECSPSLTFEIYADDRVNPPVGPQVISVTLEDANTAPSITNLDETIYVLENSAVPYVIFTVIVADDDVATVSLTLTSANSQALTLFEAKDPDIVLDAALDYENALLNRIRLSVKARDAGGCTSEVKTLTVLVTDINEEPVLSPTVSSVVVDEGKISINPTWTLLDPDRLDTHTYSIIGGDATGKFTIDQDRGMISSLDYDVDAGLTSTVTLTIQVTDRGGLSDTTEVIIDILDVNDNAPVITKTVQYFVVTECTNPGKILGTLAATDQDSSFRNNNKIYFIGVTSTYFTVLGTGQVVLRALMTAGDTDSATVYASDQGQYPGTLTSISPAFVSVVAQPCPTPATAATTTPTTTPAPTTASTTAVGTTVNSVPSQKSSSSWIDENLPWVIASAILGLCLLGLTIFLCLRFCNACKTPRTVPKKVRHQPVREKPRLPQVENTDLQEYTARRNHIVNNHKGADIYNFWSSKKWRQNKQELRSR